MIAAFQLKGKLEQAIDENNCANLCDIIKSDIKSMEWIYNMFRYAAERNRLEIVKYLHQHYNSLISKRCIINAMHDAAFEGYLNIMQFLCEVVVSSNLNKWTTEEEINHEDIFMTAASNGHTHIVTYLFEQFGSLPNKILEWSIFSKNINLVKYLCENNAIIPLNIIESAAISGNLEIVIYLHKRGLNINTQAITNAINNNNFDIVQYLCNNSIIIDPIVIDTANKMHNLEIIQFLEKLN